MEATKETSTPSWTVGPATVDDLPTMVDVHTSAFRADLFSHLMLLGRPDGAHKDLMRKTLEQWFDDPNARLTKAVDADGSIVGWACWIMRKQPEESRAKGAAGDGEKEQKATNSASDAAAAAAAAATTTTTDTSTAPEETPARVLAGRMRADVLWHEKCHMPWGRGARCMVLQGLATEPAMQGRGIGSQLVEEGMKHADEEMVPCWAHASPAAHSLYERNKFFSVARDDYNLAEWAPGGEKANRGWGTYTFRCMMRPILGLPGDSD